MAGCGGRGRGRGRARGMGLAGPPFQPAEEDLPPIQRMGLEDRDTSFVSSLTDSQQTSSLFSSQSSPYSDDEEEYDGVGGPPRGLLRDDIMDTYSVLHVSSSTAPSSKSGKRKMKKKKNRNPSAFFSSGGLSTDATEDDSFTRKRKEKPKPKPIEELQLETVLEEDEEEWEEEEDIPDPPGFKGRLLHDEQWVRCPYDTNHLFINKKDAGHLYRCRKRYLDEKKAKGEKVDIVVCSYISSHHIPIRQIKSHELKCNSRHVIFHYLSNFVEKQRLSKLMAKREQERKADK